MNKRETIMIHGTFGSRQTELVFIPNGMEPVLNGMGPASNRMRFISNGMKAVSNRMETIPNRMRPVPKEMRPVSNGMESVKNGTRTTSNGMEAVPNATELILKGMETAFCLFFSTADPVTDNCKLLTDYTLHGMTLCMDIKIQRFDYSKIQERAAEITAGTGHMIIPR
jgi:hypothetical protein